MTKLTRIEAIEKKCREIHNLMEDIGSTITNAHSESEADLMHNAISKELGYETSEKIWDDYIKWDEVKWI